LGASSGFFDAVLPDAGEHHLGLRLELLLIRRVDPGAKIQNRLFRAKLREIRARRTGGPERGRGA